jgi:hypothetical protein
MSKQYFKLKCLGDEKYDCVAIAEQNGDRSFHDDWYSCKAVLAAGIANDPDGVDCDPHADDIIAAMNDTYGWKIDQVHEFNAIVEF